MGAWCGCLHHSRGYEYVLVGLKRDPTGQEGVSDQSGEGLYTCSYVCVVAVSISASATNVFWLVSTKTQVGRKVFRIREERACTRVHTFVLWLSPSVPRLTICFGGSRA